MRHLNKSILLIILMVISPALYSQTFSGATGYSSEFDDYLYDFMIHKGKSYRLLKQKVLTYPETVYASMLSGLDIIKNPMYLGNEYSSLKLTIDNDDNVYLTGLYTQKIINDTSYMFISKLDRHGINIWTKLMMKNSDAINIFYDGSDYIYIHDYYYLYKLNLNGTLIWMKEHEGSLRLFNNHFYKIQSINSHESRYSGQVCDSVFLEKIDTAGTQVYQRLINIGDTTNSMISTDFVLNIIDKRIFLSNKYWGTINVDPTGSNKTFENTRTHSMGNKIHNVPTFNNYLAVYDTLGILELANSKTNYPRLQYACTDSANSIYFAGPITSYDTDYILDSDDSYNVTRTSNTRSFIAKYANNLSLIWVRNFTGNIMYLGTSRYVYDGVEKLDIAGEYEGTINLDFRNPNEIVFTSQGQDLFHAEYIYLNNNIPLTFAEIEIYNSNVMIFPNPANDYLNVQVRDSQDFQLEIFDITGKLRFSDFLMNSPNINTIELSSLEKGYYFIRLRNNKEIITQKLLISK